jgi:hypothetical protein
VWNELACLSGLDVHLLKKQISFFTSLIFFVFYSTAVAKMSVKISKHKIAC